MECKCCKSNNIKLKMISDKEYFYCCNCKLMFSNSRHDKVTVESVKRHYQSKDPFKKIAMSKKYFFKKALDALDINEKDKSILDFGCGYGYFLEIAKDKGWKISGIEIIDNAVSVLKKKFINSKGFYGSLQEASFCSNYFNAITLWDVLVIVDDPDIVLKECFRILRPGGKIGIRVRNVSFQKFAYFFFSHLKIMAVRLGIKNPSVFHKYCFSPSSIYYLLSRLKYKNIKITNSPLTSGDPYSHSNIHVLIYALKAAMHFISKLVFLLTKGKLLIGPSLLILAEKP